MSADSLVEREKWVTLSFVLSLEDTWMKSCSLTLTFDNANVPLCTVVKSLAYQILCSLIFKFLTI